MKKHFLWVLILLLCVGFSLEAQTRGEAYWTKGLSIVAGGPTHQYPA